MKKEAIRVIELTDIYENGFAWNDKEMREIYFILLTYVTIREAE